MKEKYQRFMQVLKQVDSNKCSTCPIYKECQQAPDHYDDSPLYACEDMLFAYIENGKNFREILKYPLTND